MQFLTLLLAGLAVIWIVVLLVVLAAAIAISARPDSTPRSLLTGEPLEGPAPPAPVYPIDMARQRRRNQGAA